MATYKKYFKSFCLPVLLLIILVSYTFRDMPKMLIEGEGFYWLVKGTQDPFWQSIPRSLANFELSAAFVGTLLTKLFGANLYLYNWVWFFVMMLIYISLFFLVYVITKNKLVAFSASLIFAVNYVAQWGYLGWTYTSFLERTITIVFLLPSFLYLHLYLEKRYLKHYLTSVILFFLGIGIGQWGLLFGGAYIVYPLFWHIFNFKDKKLFYKRILTSFTFIIICLFFLGLHYVNQSNIGPRYSFGYFLLNPQKYNYLEQTSLQLSHWSNYPNLIKGIRIRTHGINIPKVTYNGTLLQFFSDSKSNKTASTKISIFYLFATLVIYLRLPKHRALLLSIILGVFIMLLTNVYFGRYVPNEQPGASRYLYMPTIWLSLFWSLFLWAVFWKEKGYFRIFGYMIIAGYYFINTILIYTNLNSRLYSVNSNNIPARDLIVYIKNMTPTLEEDTLVITPWDEMSCQVNEFLNDHIGKGRVNYMLEINSCASEGGWEKVASSSAHVIVLDYDRDRMRVIKKVIK